MNIKANETMWDAISLSISETRIVQVGFDGGAGVIDELLALSDTEGDVEANDVHEFWGTDEHGSEWRVHVLIEDVD
jgi:hypothetical protein